MLKRKLLKVKEGQPWKENTHMALRENFCFFFIICICLHHSANPCHKLSTNNMHPLQIQVESTDKSKLDSLLSLYMEGITRGVKQWRRSHVNWYLIRILNKSRMENECSDVNPNFWYSTRKIISTVRLWDTHTGPGAASTRQVRGLGMVTLGAPPLLIINIKSSGNGMGWKRHFRSFSPNLLQ